MSNKDDLNARSAEDEDELELDYREADDFDDDFDDE